MRGTPLKVLAWEHPCVCREHRFSRQCMGSSPFRGIFTRSPSAVACARDTPAYAGNTKISVGQPVYVRPNPAYARRTYGLLKIPPPTEKHPHVCGEDASLGCSDIADPETPTTMQGAPSVATMMDPSCGITPAYAGSTHSSGSTRRLALDHPRVCREHRPSSPAIAVT